MTRYRVNVSTEMVELRHRWVHVDDWYLVAVGEPDVHGNVECVVEDDGAPPELEGALVVPTFRHHADGSITVIGREVVAAT